MAGKTASELVRELIDIHCRTLIRFQRRQELLLEQNEDDAKFSSASSLLKPLLSKLEGPIHCERGWKDHYAIRLDSEIDSVLVERMSDLLDLEFGNDPFISDDCLALIEKELSQMPKEETKNHLELKGNLWEVTSNDGQ